LWVPPGSPPPPPRQSRSWERCQMPCLCMLPPLPTPHCRLKQEADDKRKTDEHLARQAAEEAAEQQRQAERQVCGAGGEQVPAPCRHSLPVSEHTDCQAAWCAGRACGQGRQGRTPHYCCWVRPTHAQAERAAEEAEQQLRDNISRKESRLPAEPGAGEGGSMQVWHAAGGLRAACVPWGWRCASAGDWQRPQLACAQHAAQPAAAAGPALAVWGACIAG